MNLDEFKSVKDTLSHAAGDEVLKTASNLLQGRVRGTDYVARLVGDEFAVPLPRSNKKNGIKRAETLDQKLNNAYAYWDGKKFL